jgi:cardiolipin synthase
MYAFAGAGMTAGSRLLLSLATMLSVLAACVSEPESLDYPTLVGRFADEGEALPLIAEEAWLSDTDFYVRFRRGDVTLYGGGNWSRRIPILELGEGGRYDGPYLLPLEYERDEPWDDLPEKRAPARLLGVSEWHALRSRLFEAILPRGEKSGIVLHFDVDDYFLYYDGNDDFQVTVIDDKPGAYAIASQITMSELVELGLPILEAFLAERGIDDRRIGFNTGDMGYYSLPFLYVNRDLPIAVFVRMHGPGRRFRTGPASAPYVQTAGHVAGSHTAGIVFRPVSSLYRLLFVTSDTVAETVAPSSLNEFSGKPVPPVSSLPGMDLGAWEAGLDEMTGRQSSRGTMRFLVDGQEFFTRFIDAVTRAESSISLRTYIFDNDDYAVRIGDLLKRRSNEGIDVRILLDGLGTIVSTIEKQPTLPAGHRGPSSVRRFLEHESEIDVRQTVNPWLTGDHVKTAIIDEKLAFTGGMNIAREYRYDWHDLMTELRGPIVDVLQYEFEKAWAHAGFFGDLGYAAVRLGREPDNADDVGYPIRALFTRADDPEIFRAQREAIRGAHKYIYVENAYFTDDVMLYELARARRRGVDVRVIMPLVTDRGPITRNNALAANAMLEHGIRVFIYPGMSHIKAAVFDGWACIGSANWDRWSFRINKELNIATSHPGAVAELERRVFDADFANSIELTEPFPERWTDHLIEVVGDYLF